MQKQFSSGTQQAAIMVTKDRSQWGLSLHSATDNFVDGNNWSGQGEKLTSSVTLEEVTLPSLLKLFDRPSHQYFELQNNTPCPYT